MNSRKLFFEVIMESILDISYKNNGSYKVIISEDYGSLGSYIEGLFPNLKRIFIVSDSNVSSLYIDEVKNSVRGCCDTVSDYVFEAGEKSKTLSTVQKCYDKLLEADMNRRDLIIGLGGGVTGDVAAFIASTYMRGCNFVNLPTSLLAMADSSVGGKCGVDLDSYKNIVGSIYMPRLVYAATHTLSTLPQREFSAGMAEVLKAGLIKDGVYYEWLIGHFGEIMDKDPEVLNEMLYKAISVKQYFITKDPFEQNERMILNLGHTIGHALEKYFDFKYLHGECVALGSIAAAYISRKRALLSDEEFYEIRDMFVPFELPISLDKYDIEKAFSNIGHDKKNTDSGLKFILLKKIGKGIIVSDVTDSEIKEAMSSLIVEWD